MIKHELSSFLNVLFDESHSTCFAPNPYGSSVTSRPAPDDVFFSINALDDARDKNPTQAWHRPDKPRRADDNVVCFRNFLIELDKVPLEEQVNYVTSNIMPSTIVHSGGKSHHFIFSLEEPLTTIKEYREVAARLLLLFPDADRTCKNPSRLSRLPFRQRPGGGEQRLVYLGNRLKNDSFMALLPLVPVTVYAEQMSSEFVSIALIDAMKDPEDSMRVHNISGRNAFFYWLGCRMSDINMSSADRLACTQEAYNKLKDTTNFSWAEACLAARVRTNDV